MRSVLRCYRQDSWSNESVVRQLPAGKNVITKAEDIVSIRHQATIGKDMKTADWEDLVHDLVNCRVYELAIAL
jgi:hypothetical protein